MSIEIYYIVAIALAIRFIPIVKIPFRMLTTYFHEIGHGLLAIFFASKVTGLVLNFDGSGHCSYEYALKYGGFRRFFIAISGYISTSVFGYIIYYVGRTNGENITVEGLYLILGLILLSILFWVREFKTLFLMLLIMILFGLPIGLEYISSSLVSYTAIYFQIIGVYVMIQGLIDPSHLIDGSDDGDGGTLQKITKIPEGFWIVLWFGVSGYFLYLAYLLK